ncbi:MAG: RHS repeat-associated core domain-containing protein [Polyangiaceae bacterium]
MVGNLTSMAHAAGSPGSWTRSYTYASASNRLASTNHPAGTRTYPHDAHGNITQLAHLAALDWDEADRLRHVEVTTGQDVFFAYDGAGRRVRKVYEHSGLREERLYLGGYELYRKTTVSTGTLEVERQTLHVADDHRRVCMVETLTVDGGGAITAPVPRYRFQLDNHLGTACVEVSDAGAVISFEEFHPYGTSSYRSFESSEVSAKRYRYTGKERDEETGLYFHGARYYAPWLGRWMSADPAGTVDGTNLFAYVRGSPVVLSDPTGTEGLEKGLAKAAREAFSSTARALEERRRAAEQTPIPPGEGNWRELRLEAEAPAQQQPRRQQTPPGIVNLTEADVEPFYVEEGMLTFEAEGQEGGRYHSREPHHPTHSSGITIGRGLDLGSFSPEHARQFLDVLLIADEISPFEHFNLTDVIGLHGDNAALAIERVELQGLEISPSAQKHLFEMTYEFMSAEVERISASPATVAEYGAVDFETLDPRIKAVLVDLRFRGDYRPRSRERIQQFAATNDVAGLREAMNDEDFWINQMGVPRDRYNLRRQYLQP